jgi:glucose/arabinose dehydrogenase
MTRAVAFVTILLPCLTANAADKQAIVRRLPTPTAVAVGADNRIYVAVTNGGDNANDGAVLAIERGGSAAIPGGAVTEAGRAVPFASGFDRPTSIAPWLGNLMVADQTQIWRVDKSGKKTTYAAALDFPSPTHGLQQLTIDERGLLYVTTQTGGIYSVASKGRINVVAGEKLKKPAGIVMDGMNHLLVSQTEGGLHRIRLSDGEMNRIVDGSFSALAWDWRGRLYLAGTDGRLFVRPWPGAKLTVLAQELGDIGGLCLTPDGTEVLVTDHRNGVLWSVRADIPGEPCDETPLALATEIAFPDLVWAGWDPVDKAGRPTPLRPLLLTHAGDGSGRLYVATQHGVIYSFANDQAATESKVFLDLQSKVRYHDQTNEEGFLGLAFHPKFKSNGQFFVFYTDKKAKLTNVVSRFRVSKDDPSRADPASEVELLRIEHRFWNHDGGTVIFGPDGYLYIALGDGGAANDPENNGQNLGVLLGKVLRIDVDRQADGKQYAIPADNPFISRSGARPEIFAYGLRNVWRMAFDRQTGKLWAADVGQNLYEEIDLLESGKNYGWNIREGLHPFGPSGVGRRADLTEPIWEYNHEIGKSITGGAVYRGSQIPELRGAYLYGDYVSMKIWALWYDEKLGRVVANRPITDPKVPILSFGEDDKGELYFMTYTTTGKGIYRFVRKDKSK